MLHFRAFASLKPVEVGDRLKPVEVGDREARPVYMLPLVELSCE